LVEPQWGQALRAVAPTRHADALRLRLFDFDIFFFGTAIAFLLTQDRTPKVSDAPRGHHPRAADSCTQGYSSNVS
jgi:hypothetical protein